nr:hypothetical protein CFP56_43320 [Quercus suber]
MPPSGANDNFLPLACFADSEPDHNLATNMVPRPRVASFGLWCKKEKKGASDTIAGSAPHQSHLGRLPNE